MADSLLVSASEVASSVPVFVTTAEAFAALPLSVAERRAAQVRDFTGKPGQWLLLHDDAGGIGKVLAGVDAQPGLWSVAALSTKLPPGDYRLEGVDSAFETILATGWGLGGYRFRAYRTTAKDKPLARLALSPGADLSAARRMVDAIALVRDLINTPASDMLPSHLATAAQAVADEHGARIRVIVGEDLLAQNYPFIHTVGRASADAPRLIDLTWGDPSHPRVTLVGKGVCFDSGGLDLKDAGNMQLMKKDMGGAAHVLGLAKLIMGAGLRVRLRVLIPAVENAVSGNAMRPLDVVRSRKGLTVEIGNTDAEGRLILCDALTEADGEKPDLLLDFATLTGAARVALGTEIPVLFTPDDALADDFTGAGEEIGDPLWRLPLWNGYRHQLDSKVADLNSAPESRYAGAITAALFLKEFVTETTSWAHLDLMAWNIRAQPGRPVGGEAMALRAAYRLIERRFGA